MLWRETLTASASCCCVQPRPRRNSFTRFRTLFMTSRLSIQLLAMSCKLVFEPRVMPAIVWPLLCLVMIGCQPSGFVVRASKTTLGVGESVQLEVFKRGPWLFDMQRLEPRSLVWRTTGESVLVPEPDGRITCVGTNSRDHESAIISAASGLRRGWRRFHVTRAGPGPSLDIVTRGSM